MKTLLSAKRQIAIPKELCDQLDLTPGSQVEWKIDQGALVGYPIPKNSWKRLRGSISKAEAGTGMNAFRLARKEERNLE